MSSKFVCFSIIDGSMYSPFVLFIDHVGCSSHQNTYQGNATWRIDKHKSTQEIKLLVLECLSTFACDISLSKVYIHF